MIENKEGHTKLVYVNTEFDQVISVRGTWDANIYEMGKLFNSLLLAAGYAPESIAEILDIEETQEDRDELSEG